MVENISFLSKRNILLISKCRRQTLKHFYHIEYKQLKNFFFFCLLILIGKKQSIGKKNSGMFMYQLNGSLTKNLTKISLIHYWSKICFCFFCFYLLFCDRYHLKDVIVGKIYFLLVRIKIKHMEIDIIKRETTGTGPSVYHENDTIAKYEIMDGAPVRGERLSFSVTALTNHKKQKCD